MKSPEFDSFFKQFNDVLPRDPLGLKADFEKNLRAAMQTAFNKLNLVSRDEFDVQAAVLLRTREKLAALEAKVVALEAKLQAQDEEEERRRSAFG